MELDCLNSFYGKIGDKTNLKDVVGRPLFVGDTVDLFNKDGDHRSEKSIVEWNDKKFVMGIMADCDETSINGGWKVIKKRNYYEINDGEIVDSIKYVGKCNG